MGPYIIARDTPASILFKNVFKEEKTFEFHVDRSEIFEIEIPSTTLHSKQVTFSKLLLGFISHKID